MTKIVAVVMPGMKNMMRITTVRKAAVAEMALMTVRGGRTACPAEKLSCQGMDR